MPGIGWIVIVSLRWLGWNKCSVLDAHAPLLQRHANTVLRKTGGQTYSVGLQ